MEVPEVDGWEHIEAAGRILKDAIDDVFDLPEVAQQRAIQARRDHGEKHGDDLVCGCWEAAMSADALMQLIGRHADAILFLADAHPGFASSAQPLARASLEGALRIAWLLEPTDPKDREQRWLCFEREETRFFRDVGHGDPGWFDRRQAELDAIEAAVGGGQPVKGVPSAESLVQSFGTPGLYKLYRFMSQSIHGTEAGAGTFAAGQEWMAQGGKGEWIEAEFWSMPLAVAWEGLSIAIGAYQPLLAPDAQLRSPGRSEEFGRTLAKVPPNYQARRDLGLDRTGRKIPTGPNRAQRREADRRKRQGR